MSSIFSVSVPASCCRMRSGSLVRYRTRFPGVSAKLRSDIVRTVPRAGGHGRSTQYRRQPAPHAGGAGWLKAASVLRLLVPVMPVAGVSSIHSPQLSFTPFGTVGLSAPVQTEVGET